MVFFSWTRYKIPGLVTSAFLSISSFSIYNLFILGGLPLNKETIFGVISLIFFSHLKVINFFKLLQKFLFLKIYTFKVAISLAKKKHNIYLYELALFLLIPGSIFIFLLPNTLKNLALLIVLGVFSIFALWWLFFNFYLPKLICSLEHKRKLIFPERQWRNIKYSRILGNEEENESIINGPVKRIRRNWAPLLMFLAFLGLLISLSTANLNYPDFFKNNQLLSFDQNNFSTLQDTLNNLKAKPLQDIPKNVQQNTSNSSSLLYYLFPEGVSLDNLISQLTNGKKQQNEQSSTAQNYTLQTTEAFSKMPDLKATVKLSFLSIVPLFIYIWCRFKAINALAFIISSISLFGINYFLLFSTTLKISNLIPEILIISFIILLISWANSLSFSGALSGDISKVENKKLFLRVQANRLKWMMRQGGFYYLHLLLVSCGIYLFFREYDIAYAIFLLVLFSCITLLFFSSVSCFWLEKFSLMVGRNYARLYGMFNRVRERNYESQAEEERVIGINSN
ncbi:hypothetical protein PRV_00565 [Mycoplasma parvum str. Indiana]|uniref:Uncharacterized protein n=1 Tax=Mycoplasma parvum str. Indiana TaxID=1403316 RepID=U5NBW7_9MOLU|nr:hypothetical protein PRV_00565 [Mycoplasma parvum str. Indiana]